MKKIAVLALTLTTVFIVQAQEKRDPENRLRMHRMSPMNRMGDRLKFSEDQKLKAKALNDAFRKDLMKLRKKDDITVKEWRSRMESLQKQHRDDLKNLLSNDQRQRVEKMKLQRQKLADINADARLERMKLRLDLNDDQVERLKKERMEFRNQIKGLRENQSLDRMKSREQMRTLMEKRRQMMKSILTDDQIKQLQEMKGHSPQNRRRLS